MPRAFEENPDLLSGQRLGLLCNPASVTLDFVPAPQALLAAGLDVRVLFGPEHGLTGAAQDMEAVGGGEPSRLPVISLYGETFDDLAPKSEHLEGLDAVVCDLPDVGSRYYTFVWSIALVMRECAKRRIPVVVLDRPNPLGGEVVEGNLPEERLLSFVGLYPVPVRHGMTPGEIARWTNATQGFGCDLTVVPMRKAGRTPSRREIAETPAWVLPSPNMPTPGTALVYPGGCLVEGTNLSEGRGTTRPFELLGAPWLDADEAAERANALGMPGVVFRPHVFKPTFQKHAGKTCGGVQAHVTDAAVFRPYETYLRLLKALFDLDPDRFRWRTEKYEYRDDVPAIDLLTGTATYRRLVDAGRVPRRVDLRLSGRRGAFRGGQAAAPALFHSKKFSLGAPRHGRARVGQDDSGGAAHRGAREGRAEGRLAQAHGPRVRDGRRGQGLAAAQGGGGGAGRPRRGTPQRGAPLGVRAPGAIRFLRR